MWTLGKRWNIVMYSYNLQCNFHSLFIWSIFCFFPIQKLKYTEHFKAGACVKNTDMLWLVTNKSAWRFIS